MKTTLVVLALTLSVVVGAPKSTQRIVGGTLATISQYPFAASLLYSYNLVQYTQSCAGTILTARAILTAGHCLYGNQPNNWLARVGSSYANSGGTYYVTANLVIHPLFNYNTLDNDVGILKTAAAIAYIPNAVQPASIAGSSYNLGDNQAVYAIGWGSTTPTGSTSEQLRQVQIWSVNQATCKSRYAEVGWNITDNMVCSGWLDVGGRDQCQGDSGGPLLHNNVVVGVCSFGYSCALPRYPGVNTRVSKYTSWIQANA